MILAKRWLLFISSRFGARRVAVALMLALLLAASSFAQQTPSFPIAGDQASRSSQNAHVLPKTVTIPADTQVALVLTHPVNSKTMHRGDEIYVQTTAPVLVNDRVAIPAGTFGQAKVNKLVRSGGRGEMSLDSIAFVFANGYIANVNGPLKAESEEGSAFANPSSGTRTGAFVAPFAGLGLGALIGAAAHTTHTSSLGSMSMTTSTPVGIGIGSMVGMAAGGIVSFAMLARSHYFYVDAGSALQMRLPQPVNLDAQQIAAAVAKAASAPSPAIAVKKIQPPLPPPDTDHGACYIPGTPGTPDVVIPGTPAIGDSPGTPPTVIPGIPPTPPTPYQCF